MKPNAAPAAPVVPPRTAGRLAGTLLCFGALGTIGNILTGNTHGDVHGDLVVAVVAATLGLVSWALPWDRWHPRATLALLPAVFGLLAFGNYANPDPYVAGVFFILIGMWMGLCHRRWYTLALAPAMATVFYVPLRLTDHLTTLPSATVIITLISVMVGEVLAYLSQRVSDARDELLAARDELLDAKDRRFAALSQRSSDVTMIFDLDGVITYVSPAVTTVYGFAQSDIEGLTVAEFMSDHVEVPTEQEGRDVVAGAINSAAAGEELSEVRVRHKDGHWIDVESVLKDCSDDPDIRGIVVTIRNIDARKQLERRLHRQAFTDELTGLANRSRFFEELTDALDTAASVAVLFIDLDGFKAINDTASHAVGDELLRVVSARLDDAVPSGALLARFGGDEFAVVARNVDPAGAQKVAERLLEVVEQPIEVHGRTFSITASIGVADAAAHTDSEEVIRSADTAMYVAKASPSIHIAHYEPAMRSRLLERVAIEGELREALRRGELVLHYQPLVDLRTERVVGAEALLRWRHPVRGMRMPADFIEIAESSDLIVPIGRWVLHEACRQATLWQRPGLPGIQIAVNVSPRQFQDAHLVDDVRSALEASGLAPELLKVEITETVLVGDIAAAAERLNALRDLGVSIALDDFGTGYSSLSYLQSLPFDVLKIDKAFIDHVVDNVGDLTLVRTICRLGHDLQMLTLAEGIETAEQAEVLRGTGIDLGQGYHYARPLPPEEFDDYLRGAVAIGTSA